MFKTEVDINSLSTKATIRWKRENQISSEVSVPKPEHRRIRSLISSSDPSKFIKSSLNTSEEFTKVSKHEDLKEITVQLNLLRKKHDFNRDSNFHHDTDIVRLKRKIENFSQEEAKTLSTLSELKKEIESLEQGLLEVLDKQEEALSASNVYKHILERMQKSRIFLDIKNEEIYKEVKSNTKTLTEEMAILNKVNNSKIKTKAAYSLVSEFKEKSIQEHSDRLEAISIDVKQRQEYNKKREDRYKRQLEIAEAAANEHQVMSDQQMRESLIVHRFWYLYLDKRLYFDMKRFNPTEKAFEKVRKIAGVNDASEMVSKFLTAEYGFNDLKKVVDDTSLKIEETQENIKELEGKILIIERMKIQTTTIDNIKKDMVNRIKVISNDKERLMKLKCIHEKIRAWGEKNLKKIGRENNGNLQEAVKVIARYVKGIMAKIDKKNVGKRMDKLSKVVDDIGSANYRKLRPDEVDEKNAEQVIRDLAESEGDYKKKR